MQPNQLGGRGTAQGDHILRMRDDLKQLSGAISELTQGDASKEPNAELLAEPLRREHAAKKAAYLTELDRLASGDSSGTVLAKGQSMRGDLAPSDVSLAQLVRGLGTGNWKGTNDGARALMTSGTTAAVPGAISWGIVDMAREQSSIFKAGALLMPLDTPQAKVARMISNPAVQWLPESEERNIELGAWSFDSATLDAHSAWLRTSLTIELVEDGIDVDGAVTRAFAAQLAETFDMAALVGDGAEMPLGLALMNTGEDRILELPDIGSPTTYAPFVWAAGGVLGAHHTPTSVIIPPTMWTNMNTWVDGNYNPRGVPRAYSRMDEYVSSHLENVPLATPGTGVAIVGDFTKLVVGLRTAIQIEVSRDAGDAFQKGAVEVRAYTRFDTMLLDPKAFCVLKDIVLYSEESGGY